MIAADGLDELRRVAGDGAHCTTDAASLPAAPGAYLLLMTIAQPLSLRIRTLIPAVPPPVPSRRARLRQHRLPRLSGPPVDG